MKRLWIATLLLAISLTFCIFEQTYISNAYTTIIDDIDKIESSLIKSESYVDYESSLTKNFKRFETICGVICDEQSVATLKASVYEYKNSSENEKIKALNQMRAFIDTIYNNQKLNFRNIL